METIAIGAEAVLYKDKDKLIKKRVSKGYRIKKIDEKIRKTRTRSEAKILDKLSFVPKVFTSDDKQMTIEMEFIKGDLLRDVLDSFNSKKRKEVCEKVGKQISEMHNEDIIHGDLTTSNMILKDEKIYFIDFGLGFSSLRVEDKATDLRLLKQALESKHYKCFEEAYKSVLKGYKNKEILDWLTNKVEKRGRYKRKKKQAQ